MGVCADLELKSAMHSLACILIRGDLCSHGDALPVIFIHSASLSLSGLFRRRAYFTHTLCVCVGEIKHENHAPAAAERERWRERLLPARYYMKYACVCAAIGLVS